MTKRVGANERQKMQARKQKAKKITGKATIGFGKVILIIVGSVVLGYGGKFVYDETKGYLKSVEIFKVDTIKISGVDSDDSLKIITALGIDSIDGSISIRSRKIKRQIFKLGTYEQVNVSRKFPSTLEIKVVERKPIAFLNSGTIKLVDSKGNLWPIKPRRYWSIPLFSGLKDTIVDKKNRLTKDSLEKMHNFLDGLKTTEDRRLDGISQVQFCESGIIKIRLESSSITVKINKDEIGNDLSKLWQVLGSIKERKEKIPSEVDLSCGKLAFVK